jgi:hypothetical protein
MWRALIEGNKTMNWLSRVREIKSRTQTLETRTPLGLRKERNYFRYVCGSASNKSSTVSLNNAATYRQNGNFNAARDMVKAARSYREVESS